MAVTKKAVKTTKKTKVKEEVKEEGKKYHCLMQLSNKCKNNDGDRLENYYFKAYGKIYKDPVFPICKECVNQYATNSDGEVDLEKFKTILRIFDRPFLEKEYITAVTGESSTIGTYLRCINLNYPDLDWTDSDGYKNLVADESKILTEITGFEVSDEITRRWGIGYTVDEYQYLEENFSNWCTNTENADVLSVQKLFERICKLELQIRRAEKNGDPTDKLDKLYMELLDKAGALKSIKGEGRSQNTIPEIIKMIETKRPAEYYADKKLYEDFDSLKEYIMKFAFRPLKNLFTGTHEFSNEYSVENEHDDEEIMDGE